MNRIGAGGLGRAAFAACGLLLARCGSNRDIAGAPVDWWHDLEGGAIAQNRPPPPGVDAPYPRIGTTPARPQIPSAAARDALTASLLDQRQLSDRLNAHDPILPLATTTTAGTAAASATTTAVAAGTPASQGQPAAPPQRSSVTFGDQPAPPDPTAPTPAGATGTLPMPPPPAAPPTPPAKVPTPEEQEANAPKLAMPPPPKDTPVIVSGPLPQMPAQPPTPAHVEGFDVPATPLRGLSQRYVAPASIAATTAGSNLDFAPASDVLLKPGRDALRHAATSRGGAQVHVTGYGDTASDTPADQQAALRLAIARAAAAADALVAFGVPAASIQIAASPFGRGGEVTVAH